MRGKFKVSRVNSGNNETIKINQMVDELKLSDGFFLGVGFGCGVTVGLDLFLGDEVLVPTDKILVAIVVGASHGTANWAFAFCGEDDDVDKFFRERNLFFWNVHSFQNPHIPTKIARIFCDDNFS
jgi:hypothetical protein